MKRTATGRCTHASPSESSFGTHKSQKASNTNAKSSCANSLAISAASSGDIPGLNRRSRTVGSDHATGCTDKYVIPSRTSENRNCRITETVRGNISPSWKLGNHKLKLSESAIAVFYRPSLGITTEAQRH